MTFNNFPWNYHYDTTQIINCPTNIIFRTNTQWDNINENITLNYTIRPVMPDIIDIKTIWNCDNDNDNSNLSKKQKIK